MDVSNTHISNHSDISNTFIHLPEELQHNLNTVETSEEKIKIVNEYRRKQIIDMVVRQTDLSPEDAEYFLIKTRGDMIPAIRLAMNGETRETLTPEKIKQAYIVRSNRVIQAPSSINQQIYHNLRSFMGKSLL